MSHSGSRCANVLLLLCFILFLSLSVEGRTSKGSELVKQRRIAIAKQILSNSEARPAAKEAAALLLKQTNKPSTRGTDITNSTDLFTVISGRYPDTVSLPDVLRNIPDGPAGRQFVEQFADFIYKKFGVPVPDFVVDMFFEDSSILLDFLQFSPLEIFLGVEALNLAYQAGDISWSPYPVDVLPSGFDLANALKFALNLSWYMPGPPAPLAPGLWQGFYPGKQPLNTVKQEIVLSLALNQLANNSHLPSNSPNRYSIVYNNQSYYYIDDLLNALIANDHTVNVYLTWRAVDFFGWLTQDSKGQWREVPVPVFMDTGVYDSSDNEAIIPAIHDEIVIEIRSGPNSKGYKFDGDLLWYEGDSGIGFFAKDLYSYATWVGTVNAEPLSGAQAVRYIHMAGVFSDTLLQASSEFDLYDYGYAATGICVDSVAVIEYVFFNEITLYFLVMQTDLVKPILKQNRALNNRDSAYYDDLLKGIDQLWPDIYGQPSIKQRAFNTLTWPAGQEPFETVVQARGILQS